MIKNALGQFRIELRIKPKKIKAELKIGDTNCRNETGIKSVLDFLFYLRRNNPTNEKMIKYTKGINENLNAFKVFGKYLKYNKGTMI